MSHLSRLCGKRRPRMNKKMDNLKAVSAPAIAALCTGGVIAGLTAGIDSVSMWGGLVFASMGIILLLVASIMDLFN